MADRSTLSMRDSVWFIPKSIVGIPVAELGQWWMPDWFQRGLIRLWCFPSLP